MMQIERISVGQFEAKSATIRQIRVLFRNYPPPCHPETPTRFSATTPSSRNQPLKLVTWLCRVTQKQTSLPSYTSWVRQSRRAVRCAAEPRNEFLNPRPSARSASSAFYLETIRKNPLVIPTERRHEAKPTDEVNLAGSALLNLQGEIPRLPAVARDDIVGCFEIVSNPLPTIVSTITP